MIYFAKGRAMQMQMFLSYRKDSLFTVVNMYTIDTLPTTEIY